MKLIHVSQILCRSSLDIRKTRERRPQKSTDQEIYHSKRWKCSKGTGYFNGFQSCSNFHHPCLEPWVGLTLSEDRHDTFPLIALIARGYQWRTKWGGGYNRYLLYSQKNILVSSCFVLFNFQFQTIFFRSEVFILKKPIVSERKPLCSLTLTLFFPSFKERIILHYLLGQFCHFSFPFFSVSSISTTTSKPFVLPIFWWLYLVRLLFRRRQLHRARLFWAPRILELIPRPRRQRHRFRCQKLRSRLITRRLGCSTQSPRIKQQQDQ